jgi:Carboxypeptidase regulatory-like domain
VKDPSGAVVIGAKVEVTNVEQGTLVRTISTGADGRYIAALLPVGHYEIAVSAPGFRKYAASNIVLNVNDRRVVDVTLQIGAVDQTVDVHETAVQVDLDTPAAAGLITGTQIRELAISTRNFAQRVALQPGVTTDMASDQYFVGAEQSDGLLESSEHFRQW